jgi:hypothetical protein
MVSSMYMATSVFFIWWPASTASTIVTDEKISIKVIKAT